MRSSNLLLAISAALLANCPSPAADLLVPSQYPTIQSAVTAAVNGDRVLVSPGIYPEAINLQGKRIRLESSQGAPSTLLDRGSVGGTGTIITASSTESLSTVIRGFTIRAAQKGISVVGSASGDNTGLTIENCVFQSLTGNAIGSSRGQLELRACEFSNNAGGSGIVISADLSFVRLTSCLVAGNGVNIPGDGAKEGVVRVVSSTLVATDTSFLQNSISAYGFNGSTSARGGAVYASSSIVEISNCRFEANGASASACCGPPNCGNTATSYGGAISVTSGSRLTVGSGTAFVGNSVWAGRRPDSNCNNPGSGSAGGAIWFENSPGPHTITGAQFSGNTVVSGVGSDLGSGSAMAITILDSSFASVTGSSFYQGSGTVFLSGLRFDGSSVAVLTEGAGGIVENCQFRNVQQACVSTTAPTTVRNNEVCNPPAQPYQGNIVDGGGNFVRPLCLAADCNYNDLEDAYDIYTGRSIDCNANGIPDECEIASGAETDCDANEILDSCQLRLASLESPSLGPVNYPTVLTHTFQGVAKSGSSVTVTFTAVADLDSPLEYLTPRLNSSTLSRLWEADGYNCPTESAASVTLTAAQFNEILGSGTSLQVAFTPSIAVSSAAPCGNSFVRVRVTYQPISTVDCDGNGALDLCEILSGSGSDANNNDVLDVCEEGGCSADFNSNGVVDGTDLAVVLAAWGPCAGASCAADINRDGSVNGLDLTALLAAWGPCGP